MHISKKLMAGIALAGGLSASGAALAATSATAVTDLNIRSGPGPEYPVVGLVGAGQQAIVTGCIQGSKWCTIDNGGWVYSDYLTADVSGSAVVLTERPAAVEVPTVTYEPPKGGAVAGGAATGAVAGALIGGPVGAAVGAVAGGAVGATVIQPPPEEVRTYVTTHAVDPIYLDGEVVVGAGVPETVTLAEIPNYEYRYVYLNGQPVLVEPQSRRIVYVLR
jgi:uncharacterized protein YraI